jgi:hypothetical protein
MGSLALSKESGAFIAFGITPRKKTIFENA